MKSILITTAVLLSFFIGYIMSSQNRYLSEEEKLVNNILDNTAKIIEKKYNIQPSGEGVAMPGGPIQEVTLCFDTKKQLSRKELRTLLVKSAQELLNQIIKNNDIQPFLINPPFTINNVEIIIYNNDRNGREVYDPEISTARISHGILTYRTVDPSDTLKFKNQFKETYHESLKALQKTL